MRLKLLKSTAVVVFLSFSYCGFSQRVDNSTWKAQISLGVGAPSSSGFIDAAPAKGVNFPTVNLGIQRMFSKTLGAKLDYGFNRFSSNDDAPEFKVNYSRINTQLVYNATPLLVFLPAQLQTVLHAGPGLSFATPLGTLGDNRQTYLNFNTGLEVHYSINRKVSVYTDVSYIYGVTRLDNYDPQLLGLGAFNGNVLNLTFGVSISLSGCYYCE